MRRRAVAKAAMARRRLDAALQFTATVVRIGPTQIENFLQWEPSQGPWLICLLGIYQRDAARACHACRSSPRPFHFAVPDLPAVAV